MVDDEITLENLTYFLAERANPGISGDTMIALGTPYEVKLPGGQKGYIWAGKGGSLWSCYREEARAILEHLQGSQTKS